MRARSFAPLVLLALAAAPAAADPKPAAVFSDHMVLQQGMAVPVWGTAEPGEKVAVSFRGQSAEATADDKGKWTAKLPAMKAGPKQDGTELVVKGKSKSVTFRNVVVGEVWLCAGQSNMEWSIQQSDAKDDAAAADFPMIRHQGRGGSWTVCTPKTVPGFTAVGFYFARKVHQETGLPVGLLNNAIGGTAIEPWLPPASGDEYEPLKPSNPKAQFSNLYNGFTEPLRPYALRGMLWYQGESNGGEGESYYLKLKGLIEGMRKAWGQGDFPFGCVQLPGFTGDNKNPAGGDGWARIRQAEAKALGLPNVGLAVTIDVGDAKDIHPTNKKDPGERLALWALATVYGKKDVVYSGPTVKDVKFDGGKARITFDNTGGGLMVGSKKGKEPAAADKDGKLKRFAVAGEDKKWVWADAVIDGDAVVVSSPDVKKVAAVRYAYSANPEGANLYNKAGLPAAPFTTDDWDNPAKK